MNRHQTEGRERNAAQPLGERHGTASDAETRRVGKAEQDSAGPDGPDPTVAAPAKRPPGASGGNSGG